MNMQLSGLAAILVGLVLSGCGTTPSNVRLPTLVKPGDVVDANEARYRLGDKAEDPLLSTAVNGTVLPIEKTYPGMLAQVRAHQVLWQVEADKLAKGVDGLNNTQFGGAVLAAAGALAKSTSAGVAGAVIAGGAGVFGDRYQLSVQSSNYRLGAGAMQCVYKRVTAIPAGFWEATYQDAPSTTAGMMRFKRAFYVNSHSGSAPEQAAASKGYETLRGLFTKVYETVIDIRGRLGEAQRNVKLNLPSGAEIAASLKFKQDQEKNTQSQSEGLTKGVMGAVASVQTGAVLSQERRNKLTTEELKLADSTQSLLTTKKMGLLNEARTSVASFDEAAAKALALDEDTLQQALQLPQDLDTCAKLIGS